MDRLTRARTAVELQFTKLTNTTNDEETSSSCVQAIATHLKITIDIARNYLEDEDTNFANGIVPITSVISGHHASVAMFRQRQLGHSIITDDSKGLAVLKASLKKKTNLWGLAGTSDTRAVQDSFGDADMES